MDHAAKENHVIDWESTKIVEKEREDLARGIKKAIYICKLPNLNRDEGRYHISQLAQYYHHLTVIHLLKYCAITVLKKSPG